MKTYLIYVNNKSIGPYNKEEVIDLINRGYIPIFSKCQVLGESDWKNINDLEDFAEFCKNFKESQWNEDTFYKKILQDPSKNPVLEFPTQTEQIATTVWEKPQSSDLDQQQKSQSTSNLDEKIIQDNIKSNKISDDDSKHLDKTIISQKTLDYLNNEKKILAEKKNLEEQNKKIVAKNVESHQEHATEVFSLVPQEDLNETFSMVEKKWDSRKRGLEKLKEEISREKINYQKRLIKNKKKTGSILLFIIVLWALFMLLPDDTNLEKKKSVYILPEINFPEINDEKDEDQSNRLLQEGLLQIKNYEYPNLLKAAPILQKSYELNDANKAALHKLALVDALMLGHSQDLQKDALVVYKILQLIGDGQEFKFIDVLAAKMFFYTALKKYNAVIYLMKKYMTISKKINTLVYAAYIRALVETGDLKILKPVFDKIANLPQKSILLFSAILDYQLLENNYKNFEIVFNEALLQHQQSVAILLKGCDLYSKTENWEKVYDILKRVKSLEFEKSITYYSIYLQFLGQYYAFKAQTELATKTLEESLALKESIELRRKLSSLQANAIHEETNKLINQSKSIDYLVKSQDFRQRNDWDLAMINALKAVDYDPNYIPAVLNLAKIQTDLGYYDLAIKKLEPIVKKNLTDTELTIGLLNVYIKSFRMNDAARLVGNISDSEAAQSENFQSALSDYYEQKNEPLKALLWLQQAVKQNPLNDEVIFKLASAYIKNNNISLAKNLITRAISLDPSNLEYHSLYADVLFDSEDPEVALGYLRQLLKDFPDHPIILNKIAIFYYRTGQIKNFESLKEEIKNTPEAGKELFLFLMKSSRKEARLQDFVTYALDYLKIYPGDLEIKLQLVAAYYELNKFDQAIQQLDLIDERVANYPKSNFFKAKIKVSQGDTAAALELAKSEVKNNPANESSYILLGDIYRLMEKFPEAENAYRSAQKINPKSVDSIKGIAYIKMVKNDPNTAIDLFEKALKWRPDDSSMYLVLGDLYRQMGQTPQAIKYYKNFLDLEPDSKEKDKIKLYLKSVGTH